MHSLVCIQACVTDRLLITYMTSKGALPLSVSPNPGGEIDKGF